MSNRITNLSYSYRNDNIIASMAYKSLSDRIDVVFSLLNKKYRSSLKKDVANLTTSIINLNYRRSSIFTEKISKALIDYIYFPSLLGKPVRRVYIFEAAVFFSLPYDSSIDSRALHPLLDIIDPLLLFVYYESIRCAMLGDYQMILV